MVFESVRNDMKTNGMGPFSARPACANCAQADEIAGDRWGSCARAQQEVVHTPQGICMRFKNKELGEKAFVRVSKLGRAERSKATAFKGRRYTTSIPHYVYFLNKITQFESLRRLLYGKGLAILERSTSKFSGGRLSFSPVSRIKNFK